MASLNTIVIANPNDACKVKFITKCHEYTSEINCGILGFKVDFRAQLITSIFLAFVGLFIWTNKKFQKHPYPLIAWTSIIQSFYFCSLTINSYQCVPKMFDLNVRSLRMLPTLWEKGISSGFKYWWSPQFLSSPDQLPSYLLVFEYYYNMYYYGTIISQNLDLMMNTLIFMDLYFSLKNPFQTRNKRNKWYILMAVWVVFINILALKFGWNKQFRLKIVPLTEFFIAYKVIMILAGFVFYSLVIHRLCMKGTSKKLRKKVLWRHTTWYIFFLYISIINAIIILNEKYSWGIFPFVSNTNRKWAKKWMDL